MYWFCSANKDDFIGRVTNELFLRPMSRKTGIDLSKNLHVGIRNDVIIAAGSDVTKIVQDNIVVGGNPVHIIGSFDTFVSKRRKA